MNYENGTLNAYLHFQRHITLPCSLHNFIYSLGTKKNQVRELQDQKHIQVSQVYMQFHIPHKTCKKETSAEDNVYRKVFHWFCRHTPLPYEQGQMLKEWTSKYLESTIYIPSFSFLSLSYLEINKSLPVIQEDHPKESQAEVQKGRPQIGHHENGPL